MTALVYASRTFLIFSFAFAYIIPFLTGAQSESIILILAYNAIISLSGYTLSYILARQDKKDDAIWLFRVILLGSLMLLVITSFGIATTRDLIGYIMTAALFSLVSVWIDRRVDASRSFTAVLIAGYTSLVFAMIGGGSLDGSLLFYMLAIVPLMFLTVTHIVMIGTSGVISGMLFVPLGLGLGLLALFGTSSLLFVLMPIVCFYGVASFFVLSSLSVIFQYMFFLLLGIFLSICSIAIDTPSLDIGATDRLILAVTTLVFFSFSVWSAIRQKLDHLILGVGIMTSILLGILLSPTWIYSWEFYGVFLVIAFAVPFLTQKYTEKFSSISIITYQVIVNLFMILELVYLGKDQWFSGTSSSLITLGLIVFALSIASTLYSLMLVRSRTVVALTSSATISENHRNLVYGLFAIPISLFSLAIAIVFSEHASIVSAAWIVESTVLAHMYRQARSPYVLLGSIVLLAIGLLRLIPFFESIQPRDWSSLVPI